MKIVALSLTLLTQLALISAVVFPGPCPDITSPEYFDCSTYMNSSSFRVAAYLPVDGTTLNIFHNPFASINCLDFGLTCSFTDSTAMQIRYNCYPTMAGNVTTGIVTQCLPLTFDARRFNYNYNQLSNFGLGLQLICPDKLVTYETDVIFGSQQKQLLGIWGCRDLGNGTHDEGAWVLAPTNKDLPSDPQVILEQFLESVHNMSASPSDFVMNDFSTQHTCTCAKCDYTLECPVAEKEQDASYSYYQDVSYDDYPQYDDYSSSSNTYDSYPDYNTPAPAYYYYYDDTNGNSTEDPISSTKEATIRVENITETSLWVTSSIEIEHRALSTESSFHPDGTTIRTFTTVKAFEAENVTEVVETFESNKNETTEDH